MGLYTAGVLLLVLRGGIPDVLSVLRANFLLILSCVSFEWNGTICRKTGTSFP